MKPTYKVKNWGALSQEERQMYMDWITCEGGSFRRVRCDLCDVVIFKAIEYFHWKDVLTVKEQRHQASKKHQYNLLFQKLADGE